MSGSTRGQWTAVGVIVTLLGAALISGLALQEDIHRVAPGKKAPDFAAVNLMTGDSISLADYAGEVVLINLWATWCAPCRVEMPSLERLYEELGSHGLKIVAISVDQLVGDRVAEFADELGLTFDILHDRSGNIERGYQTTGLPETLLLDRDGIIVHKVIGPVEWDAPVQVARIRRLLGLDETSLQAGEADVTEAGASGS